MKFTMIFSVFRTTKSEVTQHTIIHRHELPSWRYTTPYLISDDVQEIKRLIAKQEKIPESKYGNIVYIGSVIGHEPLERLV